MLSEPQGSLALGVLHHHTQVFMWMLGIRIQVLVLIWQALYSRSHLPNLEIKLHQNLLKKMETVFLGGEWAVPDRRRGRFSKPLGGERVK